MIQPHIIGGDGAKGEPPFHSDPAFNARMTERMLHPKPVTNWRAYYHVSLMPGWEPVVAEQLAVFAHVGVTTVYGAVLAANAESVAKLNKIAAHYGVAWGEEINPLFDPGFGKCEGPTLEKILAWAKETPDAAVLYVHTKGASVPHDRHKRRWRHAMTARMVGEWRENLKRLETADLVGCAWQPDRDFPHFCGNFWWARTDWLAHLPGIEEYRASRPDFLWAGVHSWKGRMYAETWVGCRPWHHVDSVVPVGYKMWSDDLYALTATVKGFDYDAPLYLGD